MHSLGHKRRVGAAVKIPQTAFFPFPFSRLGKKADTRILEGTEINSRTALACVFAIMQSTCTRIRYRRDLDLNLMIMIMTRRRRASKWNTSGNGRL